MTPEITVVLTAIFLAAIPLNVYVARDVRNLASMDPPIDILSLLSQLVDLLAAAASIIAVITFVSVFFLLTNVRLLPVPIPTIALVVVLIGVSFANLLVWRYLRRMRNRQDVA